MPLRSVLANITSVLPVLLRWWCARNKLILSMNCVWKGFGEVHQYRFGSRNQVLEKRACGFRYIKQRKVVRGIIHHVSVYGLMSSICFGHKICSDVIERCGTVSTVMLMDDETDYYRSIDDPVFFSRKIVSPNSHQSVHARVRTNHAFASVLAGVDPPSGHSAAWNGRLPHHGPVATPAPH